ncbi:MAG: amidohydrolase family protein, partial [Candidatus Hodarchaeota archaeon]
YDFSFIKCDVTRTVIKDLNAEGDNMDKLIRRANVVDVINGKVNAKMNIFIQGDTIVEISNKDNIIDLAQCEVIDLEGCFVIPGLIDLHTHLIWSAGSDPVSIVEEEGIQVSLLHAAFNARKTVEAGITTVRDLGSNENIAISLAKSIERGYVVGPRVIASGCTIIMTGGHDRFWGQQIDGEAEALKAVRNQVMMGAQVIKVSASGGVYGRSEGEEVGTAELTYKELKVICDEAHRFGLRVAAHSISEEGIWNCIKAGIDTIEHGHFLTETVMEKMKEDHIFWIPTLFVYRQIADGKGLPLYAVQKAREIVDIHRETFKKALVKGVHLACGSDAGSPNTPHTALLNELECMVEYGCEPLDALRKATYIAAQALGIEKHIGALEIGKKADLLVASKNPLEDISNLRSVIMVIKGGEKVGV